MATAEGTRSGSPSGARSTNQTPSGWSANVRAASFNAKRVLPAPPVPTTVNNRPATSPARSSASASSSSVSRPTKRVRSTGRLWGTMGASTRQSRPSARLGNEEVLTPTRARTIIPPMREEPIRRRSLSGPRSPGTAPERWRFVMLLVALAASLGATPRRDTTSLSNAQRAALAHKWAVEGLTDATVEGRQRALHDIELAIKLEPDKAEHWLVLGQLQVLREYDDLSRASFRRAMILDPTDPAAYLELAASWKRDALRTLDTLAFVRAMGVLDTAA